MHGKSLTERIEELIPGLTIGRGKNWQKYHWRYKGNSSEHCEGSKEGFDSPLQAFCHLVRQLSSEVDHLNERVDNQITAIADDDDIPPIFFKVDLADECE
jgi:hypothetical protein